MTFFLWCEWIGKNCNELHRAKFDVKIGLHPAHGFYYVKQGIAIHDTAYTIDQRRKYKAAIKSKVLGSTIYVQYNDTTVKIKMVLTDYLHKYYAVKKDTLTIEVCA